MKIHQILLIDDDRDDLELFMECLDALGHRFTYCAFTNSIAALDHLLLLEKLPDLIFIDINMPCMNGYELLKEIKSTDRLKDIEVILISNPSQEYVLPQISRYTGVRYMRKPCTVPGLRASLGLLLESYPVNW